MFLETDDSKSSMSDGGFAMLTFFAGLFFLLMGIVALSLTRDGEEFSYFAASVWLAIMCVTIWLQAGPHPRIRGALLILMGKGESVDEKTAAWVRGWFPGWRKANRMHALAILLAWFFGLGFFWPGMQILGVCGKTAFGVYLLAIGAFLVVFVASLMDWRKARAPVGA